MHQTGDPVARRQQIQHLLAESELPIRGHQLASMLGVTRQVIVQDIAILRAEGASIQSTTRGYCLQPEKRAPYRSVIAVQHQREQTADELFTLVDHGVRVVDVIVEHPVYGELSAPLWLETRADVQGFLEQIEERGASLLSSLTDGFHLHTVESDRPERIEAARAALHELGILAENLDR